MFLFRSPFNTISLVQQGYIMDHRHLDKLTVPQLVKKFLVFREPKSVTTVFTMARPLSLSRARSIQPKLSQHM